VTDDAVRSQIAAVVRALAGHVAASRDA
jgi:hypothetical protein